MFLAYILESEELLKIMVELKSEFCRVLGSVEFDVNPLII
jgi:hypothetical protein